MVLREGALHLGGRSLQRGGPAPAPQRNCTSLATIVAGGDGYHMRIAAPHDLQQEAASPDLPPDGDAGAHVLHLPSPLASLRHSLPALIEGVVGPFVVFYVLLLVAGMRGALIGGLVWCYAAVARHLLRKRRPPGTVLLGAAILTARTVVSFATGSAFLYFVQPTLGTALVAVLFLGTAVIRRPLVERLARDFCPIDPDVLARPAVRRFFLQISVLWGAILLANSGLVFWLLLTSSLKAFVLERTASSWALTALAAACSTVWFLRAMRREGLRVRWGPKPPAAPVAEG